MIAPQFQSALFAPAVGTTWMRILPPHAASVVDDWLYTFQVYDLAPRSAGFIPEIAVPSSLIGAGVIEDRIQIFNRFLAGNYPHFLQKRGPSNSAPLELFAKDRAVCWAHIVRDVRGAADELPLRLWYGSYYRGNATLRPGYLRVLADLCAEEATTFDGPSKLRFGDISHPTKGRLVALKLAPSATIGSVFSGFSIDERAAPLAQYSKRFAAHPAFAQLNIPLEQTIVSPNSETLTEALENYLGWQVRNGLADETVYEAYARCFGEPVREDRRVGVIKRPVLVLPAQPTCAIQPPVIQTAHETFPSAKTEGPKAVSNGRIVDDLDDLPLFGPNASLPNEHAPVATNLPDSKDELLVLLRAKIASGDKVSAREIATTLSARFGRLLTLDDLDAIEAID